MAPAFWQTCGPRAVARLAMQLGVVKLRRYVSEILPGEVWWRCSKDLKLPVLINHILHHHHHHHHQDHRTSFILCMIAACSSQWLGWPSSLSRWWFVALYSGHFEGGQAAVEHDGGGLWRVMMMMMMMGTVCQQQHSQCFCKNVSMDHRGHEGKLTWCIKLQASQSFLVGVSCQMKQTVFFKIFPEAS